MAPLHRQIGQLLLLICGFVVGLIYSNFWALLSATEPRMPTYSVSATSVRLPRRCSRRRENCLLFCPFFLSLPIGHFELCHLLLSNARPPPVCYPCHSYFHRDRSDTDSGTTLTSQ